MKKGCCFIRENENNILECTWLNITYGSSVAEDWILSGHPYLLREEAQDCINRHNIAPAMTTLQILFIFFISCINFIEIDGYLIAIINKNPV